MTTSPVEAAALHDPLGPLPHEFTEIMRPELPGLRHEIFAEISRAMPEYAPVFAGPYGRSIQLVLEQSLATFVDRTTSLSAASTRRRDKMFRRLGRFEAYEGRSLDSLQSAVRLGARLALRRARTLGRRYNLSPGIVLIFADALLAYVDELVTVAGQGHSEARSEIDGGHESLRRRLLHLIVAGEAAPGTGAGTHGPVGSVGSIGRVPSASVPSASVTELAGRLGWPLPEEATLVAMSAGAKFDRAALGGDVLPDLLDPRPYFLIPGPLDEDRRALLDAAPSDVRAAVGLTLPLGEAENSLRWARRTLGLVEAGVVGSAPVTFCEEHLVTLWLTADPALVQQMARRLLAPLAGLTEAQRLRVVETLRAWLATRGNAARMAEILDLHPQTVRYRLRNLDRSFGSQLTDIDHRFTIEAVLRALQLQERGTPQPTP